jgi:hypothetical protein
MHRCTYNMEECDNDVTCDQIGFYGASTACADCSIDSSNCDACGPDARLCKYVPGSSRASVAVKGDRIAYGNGAITVFDDRLEPVFVTPFAYGAAVGVADGWLMAGGTSLSLFDDTGVLQSSKLLPAIDPYSSYALSAPMGGRVLVGWGRDQNQNDFRAWAAIATEDGTVENTPIDLGTTRGQPPVATDGTAFYTLRANVLVRISSTGAATNTYVLAGFSVPAICNIYPAPCPQGRSMFVETNATGGGVVATTDLVSSTTLQRFDAAGAAIGTPVTIASVVRDMIIDGPDVLALTGSPTMSLVKIDVATGAITPLREVGAGHGHASLERHGADVVVAWGRGHWTQDSSQIAFVTP